MLGSKLEALKCEALNKISREINKGHVFFAGDTRRFDGNFLQVDPNHPALHVPLVESKAGPKIVVNGTECLNLATHNYLGFAGKREIEDEAVKCIKRFGVGSCGPRAFYGTADVHVHLEEKLAEFFGCEQACLYSYGFSTIASAIPAYAKRGDIIFV